MANLHSRRSFRKPETEEDWREEEEVLAEMEEVVEEEEEVEKEEEEEAVDPEKKKVEVHGTFSDEYFWKALELGVSNGENSEPYLPRFTSILSPSLSPTPPLSQRLRPSQSETQSWSSQWSTSTPQKSTAPARPFLYGFPGPRGCGSSDSRALVSLRGWFLNTCTLHTQPSLSPALLSEALKSWPSLCDGSELGHR